MKAALLFILLLTSSINAKTNLKSKIFAIDYGTKNEEPMLLLASGEVAYFPSSARQNLKYIESGISSKATFNLTVDEKQRILYIHKVNDSREIESHNSFSSRITEQYSSTILGSLEEATKVFLTGRRDSVKTSQCYNRAHIWSYEWERDFDIRTSKVWLYFTRKYIRRYNFQWWFHVAPTVLVKINNEVKERIMDIKYLNSPSTLKQWTDVFIRDRSDCPVIEKFSDYANFPESSLCYVQRSNPYFYQPVDLERFEYLGEEKMEWIDSDIAGAYLEAFEQKNEE